MKPAHINHRRDANEPAIIAALRRVGASVKQLSGPGLPDLLVGYCGGNWLMEVKSKSGQLTPEQQQWMFEYVGTVHIVREPKEALRLIGVKAK